MSFLPAELIKKKRNGLSHTAEEIQFLIESYSRGQLPDYQMSAWLMAVYFKGMTSEETALLTKAMLHSGRTLDFSHLPTHAVDKHSTGGVGDKTSLILTPLVAAAGVYVPMIAGRGLGHTGGTLDKLEAIPGFSIKLTLDEFKKTVEKHHMALIGQTEEICPADKKIYALRDVTATVESLPLICASIMSKKLAEGIDSLVLDVKFGSGAFMKTLAQAEELADKLMDIGVAHGKKVSCLLTNMEQPLGCFIGNSLEVGECIAIMKQESYLGREVKAFADTRELTLRLAAEMIWLGEKATSPEEGYKVADKLLNSGAAYDKFLELCQLQGGRLSDLPTPANKEVIKAQTAGFVSGMNTEKIGLAALSLGAGRIKTTDTIEPTAGIEMHRKLGDEVKPGDPLFTLYGQNTSSFTQVKDMLLSAVNISLQKSSAPDLIAKRKVK